MLIKISFLKAVAQNYINWRGNIPTIIFQNFYCRLTQHKTKYILCIEQLNWSHKSSSYSESMQPPLHKYNSVQGNPFVFALPVLQIILFASTFHQCYACFWSFSMCCPDLLQQSTIHCPLKIVDIDIDIDILIYHMLKAIWPFYLAEKVWKALLVWNTVRKKCGRK